MSKCFRIYNENLVESADITASSENLQFPVSNIKDPRRTKVFRSLTNSDSLVLDFQETSEINGIFLVANKRDGFGVSTVTVEFNHTSDFSAPPYSVAVPFSVKYGIGHVTFDTVEYRFARIVMTSSLEYCEISKIFIGKEMETKRGISFGWTCKDEELSLKSKNRYGQLFTDVIIRQKVINVSLKMVDKVDNELFNELFDRVGETKPFYVAIGNDEMTVDYRRYSGPVTLDDIPAPANPVFGRYNFGMTLREVT